VRRQFKATRTGQLHVADFTYVPLDGGGFGYTALVIDAFAGLIPGWDCSLSKQTSFVERAIRHAAGYRERQGRPFDGTAIHHSDAGGQYTSVHFTETLLLAGLIPSIGTVGDALDNALAETTMGLYKTECTGGRVAVPHRADPRPGRPRELHLGLGALVHHQAPHAPARPPATRRSRGRLLDPRQGTARHPHHRSGPWHAAKYRREGDASPRGPGAVQWLQSSRRYLGRYPVTTS
jgi:transposase InsO family protein